MKLERLLRSPFMLLLHGTHHHLDDDRNRNHHRITSLLER